MKAAFWAGAKGEIDLRSNFTSFTLLATFFFFFFADAQIPQDGHLGFGVFPAHVLYKLLCFSFASLKL